jgi:hypothetical protein
MAYTDEFETVLRKFRREFGFELGTDKAYRFAIEKGIQTFQPRRKYGKKFKKQRTSNPFFEPELFEL